MLRRFGSRWPRRLRLGLRNRVTLGFGALALTLSLLLAVVVWFEVSRYLLGQRQSAAVHEIALDAAVLQSGLRSAQPDVPRLLNSLPSTSDAASLLSYRGEWYATSLSRGPDVLPGELSRLVGAGTAARQRIAVDGQPYLVVGLPLDDPGDAFFELFPLADVDRAYRALSITLIAAAAFTSLLGVGVGWFASRRAMRPLTEVTEAAAEVARGNLDARVDAEDDPDLARLATSFNNTASALRQRVIADARFTGDVSHELRTPLTTMLNSMQLLQNRRAEMPPGVGEPLDLLADDLDRFRRLVVDLLEISRYDSGDDAAVERVTIADLVRRAADAAAGRSVTVVDDDAAAVTVLADKRRLERVVTNLVENADSHGGGCLAVRVHRTAAGVRIVVDDAGPGVAPERRERIFERFYRDGSDGGHGVGLGLAIVARHVQWHRGTVSIGDRPGGGARFVIELPEEGC